MLASEKNSESMELKYTKDGKKNRIICKMPKMHQRLKQLDAQFENSVCYNVVPSHLALFTTEQPCIMCRHDAAILDVLTTNPSKLRRKDNAQLRSDLLSTN